MPLRAVILDLDGTLLDRAGSPVEGIPQMVAGLEAAGISIAIASNKAGAEGKITRAGIPHDLLITREVMGGMSKGSPDWVDRACAEFGVGRHEIVWLGDGLLDMASAVNAKVAYFNAGWSNPGYKYGIQVAHPGLFALLIQECFAKPVNWFVSLNETDAAGHRVSVRAMTDSWGGGSKELEDQLVQFLKERRDFPLGPYDFGFLVTLHLLGSIYGSGVPQKADTWTIYPGSKRAKGANASLTPFMTEAARLFHDDFVEDLIIRHTDALDSGETRFQGGHVSVSNQVDTVHLNSDQRSRVEGKNVVVVDDFETDGNSLEWARNLLLQGGAAGVLCISIGKYNMKGRGYSRHVLAPSDGYTWDAYAPVTYDPANFRGGPSIVQLEPNRLAPTYFRDSLERISKY
jgi:hypothetical protein